MEIREDSAHSEDNPTVDAEKFKAEVGKAQRLGLVTEIHHQVRAIEDVSGGTKEDGDSYL
jgi:hypothetical protein